MFKKKSPSNIIIALQSYQKIYETLFQQQIQDKFQHTGDIKYHDVCA